MIDIPTTYSGSLVAVSQRIESAAGLSRRLSHRVKPHEACISRRIALNVISKLLLAGMNLQVSLVELTTRETNLESPM